MKKLWLLLIPCAVITGDQLFKAWIESSIELNGAREFLPGLVRLIHVQNTGAAFGMLAGARWFLMAVSCLAIIGAFYLVIKNHVRGLFGLISIACVIGGAVGNLIDRVRQGFVVDMFEFEFINFAIFNIADIFVSLGGVCMCVYLLFIYGRQKPAVTPAARPDGEAGNA